MLLAQGRIIYIYIYIYIYYLRSTYMLLVYLNPI